MADSEGDPLPTTAESEPDIATESTGSSSEPDHSDGEPDALTTQANPPISSENIGTAQNALIICGKGLVHHVLALKTLTMSSK